MSIYNKIIPFMGCSKTTKNILIKMNCQELTDNSYIAVDDSSDLIFLVKNKKTGEIKKIPNKGKLKQFIPLWEEFEIIFNFEKKHALICYDLPATNIVVPANIKITTVALKPATVITRDNFNLTVKSPSVVDIQIMSKSLTVDNLELYDRTGLAPGLLSHGNPNFKSELISALNWKAIDATQLP